MTVDEVLDVFRAAGAILEGHFILTSGLRSPVFLQKARVFMHPDKTEILCKALAERIRELARQSGVPILPQPLLARLLHKSCREGQLIPANLYHAVAEVLAYVYRLRARK